MSNNRFDSDQLTAMTKKNYKTTRPGQLYTNSYHLHPHRKSINLINLNRQKPFSVSNSQIPNLKNGGKKKK